MSTTTLDRPAVPASIHLNFARVVAAEVRKTFSLRSTWWTLGVAVVLQVGTAALMGLAARAASSGEGKGPRGAGFSLDASQVAGIGLEFSQLAVVALAVLMITSEYSSGQIRVSLAAVPRRTPVLAAKALVLSVVVAVLGAVGGSLSVGAALLIGGDNVELALPGAETARILAGGPLYLVGIALLSLAVGALMRNSAGAIATLMAFIVVVQNVIGMILWKPLQIISPWLPGTAGSQLMATDQGVAMDRAVPDRVGAVLDPWVGYGVLIGYAVIFLVAAVVSLRSRDA